MKLLISLDEPQYEWLRRFAFDHRIPMTALVREALNEYRERHDPQLPLPLAAHEPPAR